MRNVAKHGGSITRYIFYKMHILQEVDSNIVESYNFIIAKVIGGKRMNYAMSKLYSGRCMIVVVSKNTKHPIYSLHKTLYSKIPVKNIC